MCIVYTVRIFLHIWYRIVTSCMKNFWINLIDINDWALRWVWCGRKSSMAYIYGKHLHVLDWQYIANTINNIGAENRIYTECCSEYSYIMVRRGMVRHSHCVCIIPLTECRKIGYACIPSCSFEYLWWSRCIYTEHTGKDIIIRLASRFIDLINFRT